MKTIVATIKWMIFLALLPLLVSCGDSGTAAAPTRSTASKLSVRFIGTMPTDLADELNQEFSQADIGSETPLIISGVDFSTLSVITRSEIKASFDNDIPVILVRPTRSQREALRALVGLEGSDFSEDIPEFWGLQTSRKFEIWEYAFVSPSTRQVSDTDITTYREDGTSQISDGTAIENYLFDLPDYQLSRVSGLREWLTLGPERANSQEVAAAASKSSESKSDEPKAILEQVVLADQVNASFNYLSNTYGVSVRSRAVYQAPYHYFIIQARGILNAYDEWMATTDANERSQSQSRNRGRIADSYYLSFSLPDAVLSDDVAIPSNILPKTEEQVKEITNTLGWSLSGKVTGGVECDLGGSKKDGIEGGCTGKVGGELSFGVTTSENRKFTVADITTENKSESARPAWLFTIKKPDLETNWIIKAMVLGIKQPASLATSTFQPEMTWVWRVSDSFKQRYPKGLPITIQFKPVLRHMYMSGLWTLNDVVLDPGVFTVQRTLPWPPTTATVKK